MSEAAVRTAFRDQAKSCDALGSPLTARVLRLLAEALTEDTLIGKHILNWPGDPHSRSDSLALRLTGGLHALILHGKDAALEAAYADPAISDAALLDTVTNAMAREEAFLRDWLKSAPQTNEVRRSVGLIAAGHWLAQRCDMPFVLSELGASAGLNLIWDRYALQAGDVTLGPENPALTLTPEWRGAAPPPNNPPTIAARAGVDLAPIDPVKDRLRLRSYIWADQKDRHTRTGIALDEVARLRPEITKGDAIQWLETRLAAPIEGHLHLVFHTIAWQYFPQEAQKRGEALFQAAGRAATAATPLAHLAMEADDTEGPGAALTLRLWPGNQVIPLGRVDFHGRWIDWHAPATL